MRKHCLEYYKGYFGCSLFGLFWSIVYIHVKRMSFFTFNKRKQQKKLSCSNKRGRKVFIWIALKQKESKWWDSTQKYKAFHLFCIISWLCIKLVKRCLEKARYTLQVRVHRQMIIKSLYIPTYLLHFCYNYLLQNLNANSLK